MMQPYTFTSWDQIERWVRDNGLVKWDFAATNRQKVEDGSRVNDVVANSEWYDGDIDHKLSMTQKQLAMQPGRYLYGRGWHTANGTQGAASCEICLGGNQMQSVSGFAMQPAAPMQQSERDQLKEEIRQQIETEFAKRQLENDRKQLDAERKAFDEEKTGVIGMLVNYLAPAAKAVMGQSRIAGLDVPQGAAIPQNTSAHQEADTPENQEPAKEDPFTDEEAKELEDLLVRFKAAEPEYLTLLRKVVAMAETGDATYTMAKQFLCK